MEEIKNIIFYLVFISDYHTDTDLSVFISKKGNKQWANYLFLKCEIDLMTLY